MEAQEALTGSKGGSQDSKTEVEEEGAEAAAAEIFVHSLAVAACGDMALRREAPDAEALEEDTVGAVKEAALVDDEKEGKRSCLMGAGPLLSPLHCLPSVEACVGAEAVKGQTGSKE